ncbi:MAG: hypothetical protein AYK19_07565 [Theionarchaea archaeon DG-70-1]|nr:MAG: hypothetical protein AYK19_07565 [Theionarchaea archaeon DG-70-1]
MEYIALALEHDKSHLLKKARLKISEWLDFRNRGSNVIATIYLEFFDSRKSQELDHIYMIIPKSDFRCINLPTKADIEEENEILKNKELSRKIDMKSRFIPPISVKKVHIEKQSEENVLIRIDLKEFRINNTKMNRFQFRFHIQDSFRKKSELSSFLSSSWDWIYEAPIHPLVIDRNEFNEIVQISVDLELWVMIEPAMYNFVSDLNIRSTRPFDRFIILPDDIADRLERDFVIPKALCIRWFFPEFSEYGLGAEIIVSKKRSAMEREKKYVSKINSDENYFLLYVNQILNDTRIACVDLNYIADRLSRPEFSRFLEILSELTYYRNDDALSKLKVFVEILEELQELKYGKYYFHMYRLLNQMRACKEVQDIIKPNIKKWLEEFIDKSEFTSKAVIVLFKELRHLIEVIEQFYYYYIPEEKYLQKRDILTKIAKLRNIAENKLVEPESYLMAEEILNKWELLVEKEFKQFVGSQRLNVELKTKKLLDSRRIHLIFGIANIGEVPLINLIARLLPSDQYEVFEQEKKETTKRIRLTKSNDQKSRIFSPEFVISPKTFPHVNVQLKVESLTEERKKSTEIFDIEVELFHESIKFEEIQNPYIVGNPIKTKSMFYGRKDIFNQISGIIIGVLINPAIIYGQYRIGKTSVLYQLMNKLKGEYVPVLAITQRLESGDSGLLRFWSAQISNVIKDGGKKVPKIPDYDRIPDPYRGFQEFLDMIMEEIGEKKIIFMIDEYDLIDDLIQCKNISEELFHLLDWMIKHDRIEPIMAGRLPMENLKTEEWKKIARPFVQIRLGPLSEDDAKELITKPVEGYIKYDDSAVEKILRLTNCHPYLVQLCCHVLVNYHNSRRKCVLGYSDVENCIPDMIELGSPGLEAMILADTTSREQIVLRVVSTALKGQTSISEQQLVVRIREYNPQIEDRDIKEAISNLERKEIIRSVTEEIRRFKFVCDMFRYWIDTRMEPPGRELLFDKRLAKNHSRMIS